jgi:hypothetical protein
MGTVPAIVEEATRRSAVVWVSAPGSDRAAPVWHLWHEGRAYVVHGGLEQPLPGVSAGDRVVVLVRSKATQSDRLVQWVAHAASVEPGTPLWDEVVPLLHAKRLNPPDGAAQPDRWARESTVLQLTPTGELVPVER